MLILMMKSVTSFRSYMMAALAKPDMRSWLITRSKVQLHRRESLMT